MIQESAATEQIIGQGVLPLFYHADAARCAQIIDALYAAGVRAVEFTNRGEAAYENFGALLRERETRWPDLLLGIGTILTPQQAAQFVAAGADFLVSPMFDAGVADVCYLNKVLWIPGCATPTEIHVAGQAGSTFVKLFPGSLLGPGFVRAVRDLFPAMRFMPTGGVDTTYESLAQWFGAGVAAVGMGSQLIGREILDNGNLAKLTDQTRQLLSWVRQLRQTD